MTAINAVVMANRQSGFIITDSIASDDDGSIVGFGAKVWTMPHIGGAIAVRGYVEHLVWAAHRLGDFATFDAMLSGATESLRHGWPSMIDLIGEHHCAVVVIGWSESAKRIKLMITNSRDNFVFAECQNHCAPLPDDSQTATLKATGNPIADAMAVLELQRSMPDLTLRIGGHAVLTTVGANGAISQRLLKRWPDVVGQRIAP